MLFLFGSVHFDLIFILYPQRGSNYGTVVSVRNMRMSSSRVSRAI